MTVRPTFTRLLDWVEGRLDPEDAEAVAAYVAADSPASQETVDWIRGFLEDARRMPLRQPPADLSIRLHDVFDRLHRPGAAGDWSEATLLHDTRSSLAVAGLRSLGEDGVHLAFESDLGRFVLDAAPAGRGEVDIQGLIAVVPGSPGVDLAFLEQGDLRRAVRVLPDGRFEARAVPIDVDEIWLTSEAGQVRAPLDLRH